MARPKLLNGHREALLTWLAADYDWALIRKWFADQKWPEISKQDVWYYRRHYEIDIERLRKERRESAINSGLALKEERIARLAVHADELEAIKWQPDDKGRLWNEKSWRETLADIAAEMGHRKQTVEHTGKDGETLAMELVIRQLEQQSKPE